ncbi:MAG: hypothetical protein COC19_05000 [SAR86 cluster bacterium]|uniref:diguanylate cyclase n=1 Tax=SAR86 cluster bacterium TaxID=2030880 RepID=A0A2A4MMW3_9GAMM|nr:MAG: hypothetical protein COC19_05000 [SAR86 cluster bacterium]
MRLQFIHPLQKKPFFLLMTLVFTYCSLVSTLSFSSPIQLHDDSYNIPISSEVFVLGDNGATEDINQALIAWDAGLFKANSNSRVKMSLDNMPGWLGFQLQNSNRSNIHGKQWVLSPNDIMHSTRLVLYAPVLDNGQEKYLRIEDILHATGTAQPDSSISNFYLPSDFDESRPFFLRVSGQLSMNALLSIIDTRTAQRQAVTRIGVISILFGVLIAMAIYNFVLYIYMQDRIYLAYVAFIITVVIWQTQVTGLLFFINRDFGEAFCDIFTVNFTSSLNSVSALIFSYLFFNLSVRSLAFYSIAIPTALCVAIGLATCIPYFDTYYETLHQLQLTLTAVSTVPFIGVAISAWKQGVLSARYYVLAWSFLGAGIILMSLGIQASIFNVIFTTSFWILLGATLLSISLSFSVGDRIRLLRIEERDLRKNQKQLQKLSITDALTGLFNQRYFQDAFADAMNMARRSNDNISCIAIDVDHFKLFNDRYGHPAGDEVLRRLGSVIHSCLRKKDIPCRSGGEEFTILLRGSDVEQANKIAQRICLEFSNERFQDINNETMSCTLSAGVTSLQIDDTFNSFIKRVDRILYLAKQQGRNRVVNNEMELEQIN